MSTLTSSVSSIKCFTCNYPDEKCGDQFAYTNSDARNCKGACVTRRGTREGEMSDHRDLGSLTPPVIGEMSDHRDLGSLTPHVIGEMSNHRDLGSLIPPVIGEMSHHRDLGSRTPPVIGEMSDHRDLGPSLPLL
ncbi:hypothetical protein KP79_PYT12319 [Mizuhopecten yessoensis]|uniref:Uncharacterized protein n=1 Tax=Mizuhopecten yessoensis TaxID=6573 RepID=A0A210QQZ7_MIZYE|nr:hypothetical protein KP79_PYT12319 [Mizuhopecten yessoensis]